MRSPSILSKYCLSLCVLCFTAIAANDAIGQQDEYVIELKNNTFQPQELVIPANLKVKIIILNLDPEPEEFDSFDLNREKVLFPNRKSRIYVGPLKPGTYEYFGEFHPNTARGKIIVKNVVIGEGKEPNNVN